MASKSKTLVVIRSRSDFLRINRDGRRKRASHWLILNYQLNDSGLLRCGWTVSRQVGPAVIRNRLKRWSREFFRARKEPDFGIDINLVFRKAENDFYKRLKHAQFMETLEQAWREIRPRA